MIDFAALLSGRSTVQSSRIFLAVRTASQYEIAFSAVNAIFCTEKFDHFPLRLLNFQSIVLDDVRIEIGGRQIEFRVGVLFHRIDQLEAG